MKTVLHNVRRAFSGDEPESRRALLLAYAVALVVAVVLFAPSFPSLHSAWMDHPHAHGYLIVLVTGFVLYRERAQLSPSPDEWSPGLVMVGIGSAVWLVGAATNVVGIHLIVAPGMLFSGIAAVCGRRSLRLLVPLAMTFTLAIPYWTVLTRPLQLLTIAVTSLLLQPFGVQATIDGTFVTIPSGVFEIAGSCSGLAYFVSGSAIGALYALLFLKGTPMRLAAVSLAATLAVIGNWIRVTGIIVVGYRTEMQSDLVTDHGLYGWVIFVIGLMVFFWTVRLLDRWDTHPARSIPLVDVGARGRSALIAGRTLRVSAVAAAGPAFLLLYGALPTLSAGDPAYGAGMEQNGWSELVSEAGSTADWRPAYSGFNEAFSSSWTDGDLTVSVDELVYRDQSQGTELVHYSNRIAQPTAVIQEGLQLVSNGQLVVREAVIRIGSRPMLVRYWYSVGGVSTPFPAVAKSLELLAFLRRWPDARLRVVGAECEPENCSRASEAIERFMSRESA